MEDVTIQEKNMEYVTRFDYVYNIKGRKNRNLKDKKAMIQKDKG